MKRRPFQAGEPAPWFQCVSSSNNNYHFDTVAGRYIVLTFLGSSLIQDSAEILQFFTSEIRHYFDDKNFSFFGVTIDANDKQKLQTSLPGLRYFFDIDQNVSRLYGSIDPDREDEADNIPDRMFTLILDPNLRVLADIPIINPKQHNEAVLGVLSSLTPIAEHQNTEMHAPILVVPRVFEPELCRELIQLYEANGGYESGFMQEKDGNTVGILDSSFKRRKDYDLEKDPNHNHQDLINRIQNRIVNRLLPEIQKAFQFKATRLERYVVACYEGEVKGFFSAHRDNTAKGTAHRQFAATINLNAEEYEGGELVFPEYGRKTYKAPTGGAVIFSCSLLHEATPVTTGTRYAFLPFLYDDQSAQIRQENQKYITGETIRL